MRIGIDARLLSKWTGGGSVYLQNIVSMLEKIDSENTYYLYSNRDLQLPFKNPRWVKRVGSAPSLVPGTFWLQTAARSMAIHDRIDVFWGPNQALPFGLPSGTGKVLTVHDMVWRRFPDTMAAYTRAVHTIFHERWIREADAIIAISQTTAQDLQALLSVPVSKVRVVHHGVQSEYRVRDQKDAAQYIARRFRTSDNYVLSVGTIQPRKNLVTLIEALSILHRNGQSLQLLIAGASGWKTSEIYVAVRRCGLTEREVNFLGHVSEEDLPLVYCGARLFVFPSLYEGFGLPLVEAMASGVPIVASNALPMPEILEDAAILVSPRNPQEFADAIGRVAQDCDLRRTLGARGLRRASHFRWDAAASQTLQLFEELHHRGQSRDFPVSTAELRQE
jgi:glycosyltransferase involved in cell wall biosynthesis